MALGQNIKRFREAQDLTPLCAGGPDEPGNMQWQTVTDAKKKDKDERQLCRIRSK